MNTGTNESWNRDKIDSCYFGGQSENRDRDMGESLLGDGQLLKRG